VEGFSGKDFGKKRKQEERSEFVNNTIKRTEFT